MSWRYTLGTLCLLGVWAVITSLELVNPFFLPGPFTTLQAFVELFKSGEVMSDILSTLRRVLISLGLAMATGLPLGLLLGRSKSVYRSWEFVIDFFRSTPSSALLPLFLLIFGISDTSKIAIATFTAALVIVFNTAHGVMHARRSRLLALSLMGATQLQIFWHVIIWESLPQTFLGLRSAVSHALIVVIVAELFIGTPIGLGRLIADAQITYEIPTMYAGIFLTGLLGYGLNMLFLALERRLLHWNQT